MHYRKKRTRTVQINEEKADMHADGQTDRQINGN